jgi:hypothetical protein
MSRAPRVPSVAELKRVGVTIVGENPLTLRCDSCGATWAVSPPSSGTKLRPSYWQCVNQCNTKEATP